MASFTIKNTPETLVHRIRARAAAEHRSMNDATIRLLERALARSPLVATTGVEKRARIQVKAWRRLAGRWRARCSAAHEIERIYIARSRSRRVRF
jgi:hypothetical protein